MNSKFSGGDHHQGQYGGSYSYPYPYQQANVSYAPENAYMAPPPSGSEVAPGYNYWPQNQYQGYYPAGQQQQPQSNYPYYNLMMPNQGQRYEKNLDERLSSSSANDNNDKKSRGKRKEKKDRKKKKRRRSSSSSSSSSRRNSRSSSRRNKFQGVKQPPKHLQSDNDWICKECRNVNFPYRTHCNRCKQPKDKAALKKVRPQSSKFQTSSPPRGGGRAYQPNPDDWKCNLCGNFNFARREKCNRCKEDKAKCMRVNKDAPSQ